MSTFFGRITGNDKSVEGLIFSDGEFPTPMVALTAFLKESEHCNDYEESFEPGEVLTMQVWDVEPELYYDATLLTSKVIRDPVPGLVYSALAVYVDNDGGVLPLPSSDEWTMNEGTEAQDFAEWHTAEHTELWCKVYNIADFRGVEIARELLIEHYNEHHANQNVKGLESVWQSHGGGNEPSSQHGRNIMNSDTRYKDQHYALTALHHMRGTYHVRTDHLGRAVASYGKMQVLGIQIALQPVGPNAFDLAVDGQTELTWKSLDDCMDFLNGRLPEVVAARLGADLAAAVERLGGTIELGDGKLIPKGMRWFAKVTGAGEGPKDVTVEAFLNGKTLMVDGQRFETVQEAAWHIRTVSKPEPAGTAEVEAYIADAMAAAGGKVALIDFTR